VTARVLTKAENLRGALGLMGLVAFFLVTTVIDDYLNLHLVPLRPSTATYAILVATLIVGALAPWLARAARAKRADVTCKANAIVTLGKTIAAEDVYGVRVARAAHGLSIAIGHMEGAREKVTFLEVERREDAARIIAALGFESAPSGDVKLASRSPSRLMFVRTLLSIATLASVVGYIGGVVDWPFLWASKATGVVGVATIALSLATLVVSALRRRRIAIARRGAWDAHVALHEKSDVEIVAEPAGRAEATGAAASALARRDEPTVAWLGRVDALPANEGAYRGDAMKRDVLWEALADEHAPTDVRMAAARVLRLRYEEDDVKLRAAVADADVRVRVAAALEDDDEEAADRIERLGPLFRAH
jgi:hypothetical protein